jgi:hypothetical protein
MQAAARPSVVASSVLRLTAASLAAALLAACGAGGVGSKPSRPSQPESDDAFAADYALADLACQSNATGAASLAGTPFYSWNGERAVTSPLALPGVQSTRSLTAPGMSASTYGFHQVASCKNEDDPACDGKARVAKGPSPLKLCGAGAYPRTSIEGVAVSSLASVEGAYRFYETVPGAQRSVLPTGLLVLPRIETDYTATGKRHVLTDNLAYAQSFGGEPVIVIFPKGKRALERGLWTDLNLWEIPWALAHEYGHHIFRTHTGITDAVSSLGELGAAQAPVIQLPGEGRRPRATGLGLASAKANATRALGAVNEGFADLFAFYARGNSSADLHGVDCFAVSRDLTSATFGDGTPKALTTRALQIFTNEDDSDAPTACDAPDFTDMHAIGAIYAYGVNALLAETAATPEERAAKLLDWAGRMGDAVRAASAGASLPLLADAAIRVAADANGKLDAHQCQIVREVFPAVADAATYGCN